MSERGPWTLGLLVRVSVCAGFLVWGMLHIDDTNGLFVMLFSGACLYGEYRKWNPG